jgi:lysozyme
MLAGAIQKRCHCGIPLVIGGKSPIGFGFACPEHGEGKQSSTSHDSYYEWTKATMLQKISSGNNRSDNYTIIERRDKNMRTLGVDVSHWEGTIDWQAAKGNPSFAYYKCTDGIKFVDDQFLHNRQGCAEAGLAHAPYHYYQPALDPITQAEHFIHTAGKDYKRYIVDLEQPERDENITQKLQTFLERVELLTASRPAIYTSAGYWNEFVHPKPDWASSYDLIVAHYTLAHQPLLPIGWNTWRIWQFSDFWNFPGCAEQADADWFNGNLEECNTWFGNAVLPQVPLPAQANLKLRSLFNELRIRQSPNLQARQNGFLAQGEIVEAEELGGFDVWVRHSRGWTAVERGGYRYMEIVR